MFDAFVAWMQLTILESTYVYSRGMWMDTDQTLGRYIAAVLQSGGSAPDVDDRRARYRVILLGPRNTRNAAPQISADLEALALAALGNSRPCGAASVRAIGEPVGAGYTTENRAWYSLDFEVLF